jgi:iron complex transport system permease protein
MTIVYQFRLPSAITAICCGMALSVSGHILQQLFKNTLAGPYILGVSSGASLMVAMVIISASALPFLSGSLSIPIAGFLGASAILFLILIVSARFGYGAIILLFGVIIGQLTGALQNLLSYLANPNDLKYFTLWSMGSFNSTIGADLIIFGVALVGGLIWAFSLMPSLSVMVLGDEVSRSLGVNTASVSFQLLAVTGILTGVATAYCGPIAFIGMAIPNMVKILFKTANFKHLLIANALLGACMALVSQIISSINIASVNIPVNVSTAIIGGPFVIYILFKNRN